MNTNNSISNSLKKLLEINSNSLKTFERINEAITTDQKDVPLELLTEDGTKTVYVPSFGYMKRELERLDVNLKSLAGLGKGNTRIKLPDGTYQSIITTRLKTPANDITSFVRPVNFGTKPNYFFEDFLNPLLTTSINVSGQIPNETERVLVKRILFDSTSAEGCIAIMGPNSRELLQSLTDTDLSNENLPFASVSNLEIGMAMVRVHRITYVGELGWELYFPIEFSNYIAELIESIGEKFSLKLCGMHSVDSCRIEKAYRHFGHDITDEDHVLDAGLGFVVKLDKKPSKYGKFIGYDAVKKKQTRGCEKRVMQFLLINPDVMLYHNEPILKNGEIIGYLSSGAYGHTLGGAVGLGYIDCKPGESDEDLLSAEYCIEVEGVIEKASVSIKPMYDPLNKKIRA